MKTLLCCIALMFSIQAFAKTEASQNNDSFQKKDHELFENLIQQVQEKKFIDLPFYIEPTEIKQPTRRLFQQYPSIKLLVA